MRSPEFDYNDPKSVYDYLISLGLSSQEAEATASRWTDQTVLSQEDIEFYKKSEEKNRDVATDVTWANNQAPDPD